MVLWYEGGGVLETFETIFDVFWHREMHLLAWIIPLDGESTVSFSFFFDQALIIFLDPLQEVLGVLLTDVFDSKVINHQRKDDVAGDVTKETGGGSLVEAMGGKMGEKTVLRELAHLL